MKRGYEMRRKYIYIPLLIFMFLLSSCSGKSGKKNTTDNTPKGPVTITFATFLEEGAQAEAYKEIIKAFEASHTNIKVNLKADATNYDDDIKTGLLTDKAPDIIGLQRSKVVEYANKGYLADLSSWVDSQALKDKYFGVSLGYGKFKDKYYGIGDLPYSIEWYYNTDMFKKAGIKEPENLNELQNACSRLARYTKMPIMLGAKDPWAINTFFGLITGQTVKTSELSEAYAAGTAEAFKGLNGANGAVDIFNKLLTSGSISRKAPDYDYASAIDSFVNGKAAILPMGSWAVEKIDSSKPKNFKYKAFSNPILFTQSPNSPYSATAIHVVTVNAKSKNQQAVMEFMTYLFSEEAQKIFAAKNGISGCKAANTEPASELKKQALDHLGKTDENTTFYIDNVSAKMMDSTGNRLVQLINKKIDANGVWNIIAEESYIQSNTEQDQ
jgi:ABC-type glycerol-3-phosphate transport system substrate-binding protein